MPETVKLSDARQAAVEQSLARPQHPVATQSGKSGANDGGSVKSVLKITPHMQAAADSLKTGMNQPVDDTVSTAAKLACKMERSVGVNALGGAGNAAAIKADLDSLRQTHQFVEMPFGDGRDLSFLLSQTQLSDLEDTLPQIDDVDRRPQSLGKNNGAIKWPQTVAVIDRSQLGKRDVDNQPAGQVRIFSISSRRCDDEGDKPFSAVAGPNKGQEDGRLGAIFVVTDGNSAHIALPKPRADAVLQHAVGLSTADDRRQCAERGDQLVDTLTGGRRPSPIPPYATVPTLTRHKSSDFPMEKLWGAVANAGVSEKEIDRVKKILANNPGASLEDALATISQELDVDIKATLRRNGKPAGAMLFSTSEEEVQRVSPGKEDSLKLASGVTPSTARFHFGDGRWREAAPQPDGGDNAASQAKSWNERSAPAHQTATVPKTQDNVYAAFTDNDADTVIAESIAENKADASPLMSSAAASHVERSAHSGANVAGTTGQSHFWRKLNDDDLDVDDDSSNAEHSTAVNTAADVLVEIANTEPLKRDKATDSLTELELDLVITSKYSVSADQLADDVGAPPSNHYELQPVIIQEKTVKPEYMDGFLDDGAGTTAQENATNAKTVLEKLGIEIGGPNPMVPRLPNNDIVLSQQLMASNQDALAFINEELPPPSSDGRNPMDGFWDDGAGTAAHENATNATTVLEKLGIELDGPNPMVPRLPNNDIVLSQQLMASNQDALAFINEELPPPSNQRSDHARTRSSVDDLGGAASSDNNRRISEHRRAQSADNLGNGDGPETELEIDVDIQRRQPADNAVGNDENEDNGTVIADEDNEAEAGDDVSISDDEFQEMGTMELERYDLDKIRNNAPVLQSPITQKPSGDTA